MSCYTATQIVAFFAKFFVRMQYFKLLIFKLKNHCKSSLRKRTKFAHFYLTLLSCRFVWAESSAKLQSQVYCPAASVKQFYKGYTHYTVHWCIELTIAI